MESILKTYGVKGLHCASCVSTVEKALSELEGVHNASVNLSLENVKLETESSIIFETLQDAVQNHGYTLIEENSEKYSERKEKEIHSLRKHLIYNGVLGIPLLIIAMGEMMHDTPMNFGNILIQLFLTTLIIIISRYYYINGFTALFHKNPNMNSLVALGTGSAFI